MKILPPVVEKGIWYNNWWGNRSVENSSPFIPAFLPNILDSISQRNHHFNLEWRATYPKPNQKPCFFLFNFDWRRMHSISWIFFTMIDRVVCNSVSGTKSSVRCYLCSSTAKESNNIELIKTKEIDETYVKIGFSTLHAWTHFYECFIYIGNRIGFKKW